MIYRCPGQDTRNIDASIVICPGCSHEVEIFSDEMKAKCPSCGNYVFKEKLPSCVDWCKSARYCLGDGNF